MCSVIILARFDSNLRPGKFSNHWSYSAKLLDHSLGPSTGPVRKLLFYCVFLSPTAASALAELFYCLIARGFSWTTTSFCPRQCSLLLPWYRTVTFLVPNLVLWNFWSSRRKARQLVETLDHILKFEIWNLSRVFCYQVETKTSSRQITTTQRKFCCPENRKISGETNNFGPIKGWKKKSENSLSLKGRKNLFVFFPS